MGGLKAVFYHGLSDQSISVKSLAAASKVIQVLRMSMLRGFKRFILLEVKLLPVYVTLTLGLVRLPRKYLMPFSVPFSHHLA